MTRDADGGETWRWLLVTETDMANQCKDDVLECGEAEDAVNINLGREE